MQIIVLIYKIISFISLTNASIIYKNTNNKLDKEDIDRNNIINNLNLRHSMDTNIIDNITRSLIASSQKQTYSLPHNDFLNSYFSKQLTIKNFYINHSFSILIDKFLIVNYFNDNYITFLAFNTEDLGSGIVAENTNLYVSYSNNLDPLYHDISLSAIYLDGNILSFVSEMDTTNNINTLVFYSLKFNQQALSFDIIDDYQYFYLAKLMPDNLGSLTSLQTNYVIRNIIDITYNCNGDKTVIILSFNEYK